MEGVELAQYTERPGRTTGSFSPGGLGVDSACSSDPVNVCSFLLSLSRCLSLSLVPSLPVLLSVDSKKVFGFISPSVRSKRIFSWMRSTAEACDVSSDAKQLRH